jgi:hypothetical protein
MRRELWLAMLACCLAAATALIAVGCGDYGAGPGYNGPNGGNVCPDACRTVYDGCDLTLGDANGNPMSKDDCTSSCESSALESCVVQCSAGTEANGDCTALADCVEGCLSGNL